MNRFPLIVVIAGATLFVGRKLLTQGRTERTSFASMRRRMMRRMMDAMPEDSPPRLVVSILPRLQQQNDQILVLLKEQNDLLRRLSAKR
ncbi:MAG: hypothetical protein GY798_24630 [Hyphomicrobiales bacterium]|nr:hypothetical protein [Hyphomicrobiales bacterium]